MSTWLARQSSEETEEEVVCCLLAVTNSLPVRLITEVVCQL